MNADAFRHLFDYHFAVNRRIWDEYVAPLSPEQFAQPVGYSHGSVQDQLWHLIQVDAAWFGDLTGAEMLPADAPDAAPDRERMHALGEEVERAMRGYLAGLQDGMLDATPLSGEDAALRLWQVLLHVVNHGTDHRAQILRALNDMGVETRWQDYIFFAYDNPL